MERWNGIEWLYREEDVERLRGTIRVEHSLARLGAERLWQLLQDEDYVAALGEDFAEFLTVPAYDHLD